MQLQIIVSAASSLSDWSLVGGPTHVNVPAATPHSFPAGSLQCHCEARIRGNTHDRSVVVSFPDFHSQLLL